MVAASTYARYWLLTGAFAIPLRDFPCFVILGSMSKTDDVPAAERSSAMPVRYTMGLLGRVLLRLLCSTANAACLWLLAHVTCFFFVFQNEGARNTESFPGNDDPVIPEEEEMKIDSQTSASSVTTIGAASTLGAQLQRMASLEDSTCGLQCVMVIVVTDCRGLGGLRVEDDG